MTILSLYGQNKPSKYIITIKIYLYKCNNIKLGYGFDYYCSYCFLMSYWFKEPMFNLKNIVFSCFIFHIFKSNYPFYFSLFS